LKRVLTGQGGLQVEEFRRGIGHEMETTGIVWTNANSRTEVSGGGYTITWAQYRFGHPSPNAIQSVCGHLLSLCLILDKGSSFSVGERGIRWVIQRKGGFTWLTPPRSLGQITVVDVGGWASAVEHGQQVRVWAESSWSAWAEHHDTVREWASSMRNT